MSGTGPEAGGPAANETDREGCVHFQSGQWGGSDKPSDYYKE